MDYPLPLPTTPPTTKTCDACRTRKIRCYPTDSQGSSFVDSSKCQRCAKLGIECTFDYRIKKSGRPVKERFTTDGMSSTQSSSRSTVDAASGSIRPRGTSSAPSHDVSDPSSRPVPRPQQTQTSNTLPLQQFQRQEDRSNPDIDVALSMVGLSGAQGRRPQAQQGRSNTTGPSIQEEFVMNGQVDYNQPPQQRQQQQPQQHHHHHQSQPNAHASSSNHSTNWNYLPNHPPNHPAPTSSNHHLSSLLDPTSSIPPAPSNAYHDLHLLKSQPQPNGFGSATTTFWRPELPATPTANTDEQGSWIENIENITSWSNISFFLTLYLQFQHAILPLVHKPTFSRDIAVRRDKRSESFRGLLCSIVSYVICQIPKSKLIGDFSQEELEALNAKTRATSRAIQVKQLNEPNMVMLVSTIADYNTSLAAGRLNIAAALLAEAVRFAYMFGLNRPNPSKGLSLDVRQEFDAAETEVNRRIFWHLYHCDKTESSSGSPILIHDFEGLPPLPLEVDDEFITAAGNLPQPPNRTSYMSGFVAITKLFQVLHGCLYRQRTFDQLSSEAVKAETLKWIEGAERKIQEITEDVPEALKADGGGGAVVVTRDEADVFGTQKANIWITSVCIKFALLDFRANVKPEESMKSARNTAALDAYKLLNNTAVEHLASNGESMRGKVLRIVLALLEASSGEPESYSQNVWDWWSMYSRVQFVQVIPMDADVIRPSRASSPTHH